MGNLSSINFYALRLRCYLSEAIKAVLALFLDYDNVNFTLKNQKYTWLYKTPAYNSFQ